MRAVLDVNVLISGLLSRDSVCAALIRRWLDGDFEVVASELLVAELENSLGYSKLIKFIPKPEAKRFVQLLRDTATMRADVPNPKRRGRDPGDDYIVALAESSASVLVTGNRDILDLAEGLPVLTPREFLRQLDRPAPR